MSQSVFGGVEIRPRKGKLGTSVLHQMPAGSPVALVCIQTPWALEHPGSVLCFSPVCVHTCAV